MSYYCDVSKFSESVKSNPSELFWWEFKGEPFSHLYLRKCKHCGSHLNFFHVGKKPYAHKCGQCGYDSHSTADENLIQRIAEWRYSNDSLYRAAIDKHLVIEEQKKKVEEQKKKVEDSKAALGALGGFVGVLIGLYGGYHLAFDADGFNFVMAIFTVPFCGAIGGFVGSLIAPLLKN